MLQIVCRVPRGGALTPFPVARRRDRKTFGKIAKQGAVVTFLRHSFGSLLFFPTSMILARLLTPREFGIAAAALFFIVLSRRIAELGFNAEFVLPTMRADPSTASVSPHSVRRSS